MNPITKFKNLGISNRLFGKGVVHVEMPHIAKDRLIRHLKIYKSKCYCICPSNYDYVNSTFGITLPRKEFHDFLKDFYTQLKEMGIDIQPHVHLSMIPENLPYSVKKELIVSAYNFFKEDLGIIPTEIVFGWYASDKESREIARELNLKIINEHLHVYDWWMKE